MVGDHNFQVCNSGSNDANEKTAAVLEILDGIILYMQLIQHRAQQTIDKKFMLMASFKM